MESNENLTPAGRWTLSLIADISVNYGQSANFVWLCSSILICWVLPFDWWLMVFPHDWCSLECTTLYLSTLPNLMIELERKDSNGIIKNCTTLRVFVKDEEVRRVLSNYPLFILSLMAGGRVKTIPTQITRLATDSATSSSTAPATRAENTNLLAGVIFSRSEEWEVNYPPEMEPWSHGGMEPWSRPNQYNNNVTFQSVSSGPSGEVSPAPVIDTILLTPWPMLLMTAHKHYWISL